MAVVGRDEARAESTVAEIQAAASRAVDVGSLCPMGRMGRAEEIAQAAIWLASDRASFITGIALPVDMAALPLNNPERLSRSTPPAGRGSPLRVPSAPAASNRTHWVI